MWGVESQMSVKVARATKVPVEKKRSIAFSENTRLSNVGCKTA